MRHFNCYYIYLESKVTILPLDQTAVPHCRGYAFHCTEYRYYLEVLRIAVYYGRPSLRDKIGVTAGSQSIFSYH